MWLITGLGNPGAQYARTRHNLGFLALDAIADAAKAPTYSTKFHGSWAQTSAGGETLHLLKPETFMNRSGQSVQAALAFYKLAPERLIVIHDEMDLPPGKLRIKRGGGAGGHNGVRDIDQMIGPDYWRIRLGIGRPAPGLPSDGYVLAAIPPQELTQITPMIAALAQHLPLFWQHSPAGLMSRVSEATTPPNKPQPTA